MSNAVVIKFQPRRQPGRNAPTTLRCSVGSKPSPLLLAERAEAVPRRVTKKKAPPIGNVHYGRGR